MVKLANVYIVCHRDPGSNLGIFKVFSDSVLIRFELVFVEVFNLEHHLLNKCMYFLFIFILTKIMFDPIKHAATNPKSQYVCREGPS
jgi:hypothetical protein